MVLFIFLNSNYKVNMDTIEKGPINDSLIDVVWNFYPVPLEDIQMIIFSLIVWVLIWLVVAHLPLPKFKCKELSPLDELDVRNRAVSFIHGLILVIFSGYHFYFIHGSCGDLNRQYEKNLMYVAAGYFIYDYFAMVYYGLVDITMTFHHWVCIISLTLPFTYGMSGNYILMAMYVAEGSNPFMHLRTILRHFGLRYTKAYESMEISFMLFYIYGRILVGLGLVV